MGESPAKLKEKRIETVTELLKDVFEDLRLVKDFVEPCFPPKKYDIFNFYEKGFRKYSLVNLNLEISGVLR